MFSFLFGSKKTNEIKQDEIQVKEEKEEEEEYCIILKFIKKNNNNNDMIEDNSELFFKLFNNKFIKNQIFNHCKLYKQYSNQKYQVQDYKEFIEFEEINQYITELNFQKIDPFLGFEKKDIKIPNTIKTISFSFDKQTFKDIQLPNSITTLILSKYPKKEIIEMNDIPKHVIKLVLEGGFDNQRTYSSNGGKYVNTIPFIPSTVKSLVINTASFGTRVGEIPKTLTTLDIGTSYHSRVFDKGYLPRDSQSLTDIRIGNCMNSHPLQPGDIPNSVKILRFNNDFNQILKRGIIPSSVTKVIFNKNSHFNYPLEANGSFPSSVTEIEFGSSFNQEIKHGMLPAGLVTLSLGHYFNRDLVLSGPSLKKLIFSTNFNLPLAIGVLPSSLEHIEFGDEFNRPIPKGVIPSNVTYLKLSKYFNQQLSSNDLPCSIKTLVLSGVKLNKSQLNSIPSSVTHLKFIYLPMEFASLIPFSILSTIKHLEYTYSYEGNPIDFTKLPNGLNVTFSQIGKLNEKNTIIINNN